LRPARPARLLARAPLALAPACAAALLLAGPPTAAAARSAPGAAPGAPRVPVAAAAAVPSADQMERSIAAPWPGRQGATGRYREYVPPLVGHTREQDRYGTAMMGYALLQLGVRHHDRREIVSGLRALKRAAKNPLQGGTREVFDDFALASAYNVARLNLSRDPAFKGVAHPWRERLRHVRVQILTSPRSFYNFQLVEAIEILELLRTGLHSKDKASILAKPVGARRLVLGLLFRRFPEVAGSEETLGPNGPMALLGDPPYEPLAYHAFSLGLAARVVTLLGSHAPAPLGNALAQGALASAALVGPDGDLAYAGRSQEQAWALAMTAFGERVAAGLKGTAPPVAAQERALAGQALARLAELHLGGPFGLSLTPGLHADPAQTRDAMDPYVAGVSYTGLTIVGLDWAATAPHRGSARGAPQGSGVWVLGQGPGQMAVERSGDEWFAVRLAPAEPTATSSFAGDLRYDTGLVAYKRRDGSGPWHDVTPLRPRTSLPWDSVGPLLASGGHLGRPVGHDLVLAPDGGVDLVGEWRDPAGVVVRPGELMRVALVGCGVQVQIPAQAGDELEYSVFFRQAPTGGGPGTTSLMDASETVTTSLSANAVIVPGYSSGTDPTLFRARLQYAVPSAQTITVTICPR